MSRTCPGHQFGAFAIAIDALALPLIGLNAIPAFAGTFGTRAALARAQPCEHPSTTAQERDHGCAPIYRSAARHALSPPRPGIVPRRSFLLRGADLASYWL